MPSPPGPRPARRRPTRSITGLLGALVLGVILLACLASTPWTFARVRDRGGSAAAGVPRYDIQYRTARHLPPWWWPASGDERDAGSEVGRVRATAREMAFEGAAQHRNVTPDELKKQGFEPSDRAITLATPAYLMGTDLLGRDLFIRCLAGGGVSLGIGIAAAALSVLLGTLYGSISGYIGGRVDAVMMRIVDVLYGLPYVLLVVLLTVAAGSVMEEHVSRQSDRTAWIRSEVLHQHPDVPTPSAAADWLKSHPRDRDALEHQAADRFPARVVSDSGRMGFDLLVLLLAIGGVSWLTMARVVRGQVLSLKNQPFVEAARAMGVPVRGVFLRHLLPNLVGPIVLYATLTVPQAILQESFLSFLGIGVRAPMPSWGNLAADGLGELNPIKSHWWLLVFPALLLCITLLALNFLGEWLRESLDPKRVQR